MKYFVLIILILLLNKNVYSSDLFETSFFDVEFTSKNIQEDKKKEIKKIIKESLSSILKKSLDFNYYNEVNNYLTDDLINTFIKNIIVNNEKIINEKYISKIKINFDKKRIVEFFRNNDIPYVEYHPDKFLLIIYEKDEITDRLFSKNNNFYIYFKQNFNEDYLFKIPNLDINDRFILKKEDLINRNFDKVIPFSNKYNISETIIVFNKKTKNKFIYDLVLFSNGDYIEKKLQFNEFQIDKFYQILENESLDLWKKINQIQNNSLNLINCNVGYFNMSELKQIRTNLNYVSVIKDLSIKSLSYKNIEYDISYYGNIDIFSKILNLNQLYIKKSENSCIIRLK